MKNNDEIPTTDTTEIKQLINRVKQGEHEHPAQYATPWPDQCALLDGQAGRRLPALFLPKRHLELTPRPAFHPYPAEAWVNTRGQPLVVSDPLEEIC